MLVLPGDVISTIGLLFKSFRERKTRSSIPAVAPNSPGVETSKMLLDTWLRIGKCQNPGAALCDH